MKIFIRLSIAIMLLALVTGNGFAQKTDSTTTIILLRHAEKDTVGGNDPELSPLGKKRAAQLSAALKDYTPDNFYSTPFKRTRQTLEPWSAKTGKEIVVYNPQNMEAFAQALLKMKGRTLVVAGHSNTVPTLVNLLSGSAKYQQLDDSVYNKIFIVTVNGAAVNDKIIEY